MADEFGVASLLHEVGRAVTLRQTTGGTYDEAADSTTGATTTDHDVFGAIVGYRRFEIDGTKVLAQDRKGILAPTKTDGTDMVEPVPGDLILDGADTLRVVDVRTIKPGTSVAGYVCQLRR